MTQRIVIVGTGIAGAATAYFLARRGVGEIVLLEKEKIAGVHSTGRNAAILRTVIPDPVLRGLALESLDFLRQPPVGFASQPLVKAVGVYLATPADYPQILPSDPGPGHEQTRTTEVDPGQLYRRVPVLAPGLAAVIHRPEEGVLNVHAILNAFLRGALQKGAECRFGCEATSLRISNGRITGLDTSNGFLEATRVVIASGGWAASLAAKAGYELRLVPYRRHLLVTDELPQVKQDWPVVWITGDAFYFRPESAGLLMCACDTVPVTPEQGETTDPAVAERIAAKAARWLPSLREARAVRLWAGMRTFASDERFVIGADPRLAGLYWAAGLGGHGITCSPAVGALTAQWVAEGGSEHPYASTLAPERLLR